VPAERVVSFKPRSLLQAIGLIIAVACALWVVWIARQVITWVLVSMFLAVALNPAVEWLRDHGVKRRGLAAAVIYLFALLIVAGILAALVPTAVSQIGDFVNAVPGYVRDLTHGKGPLGFLETKYHVVEKVQAAVKGGGADLAGGAGAALSITQGIVTGIVAVITIIFMTLFMILEGPSWMERIHGLFPPESQPRWRAVTERIYRTISGYVTGNLLISAIAGIATTIVLLIMGVPYALALGIVVALLDLIPLAGATLAAVIVTLVALSHSVVAAVVVGVFFVVYQQVENHVLQPVVYGRTVQLSPLAVLISVLIGAEVAGVLGALGAIPVAGTIQILISDWLVHHRGDRSASGDDDASVVTGTP
jgi:predicted PurR-regulated permease PerM